MDRKAFLAVIEEMLEVDSGSLAGNESLDELPWDSLAVVSFIAVADEHLGATVSPQQLFEAKTLEDVLNLVADKLSA